MAALSLLCGLAPKLLSALANVCSAVVSAEGDGGGRIHPAAGGPGHLQHLQPPHGHRLLGRPTTVPPRQVKHEQQSHHAASIQSATAKGQSYEVYYIDFIGTIEEGYIKKKKDRDRRKGKGRRFCLAGTNLFNSLPC